ncbi:MAG: tetratricopeptide repeat protein [Desulfobacteraceae bacterium]|nr:tetratricopeptide repeat protein [Desulfobacteraceae bacterium]MCF8095183.1 tetratricopeptide repeat protein [Desulfobacteraceae bacterium]
MAENSNRTRTPEPEAETPDFLQRYAARVQVFARAWKKQLIAAGAIFCAVIIVGAGVLYFLDQARDKASAMLISTTRHYENLDRSADKKELEKVKQEFRHLIDEYGYTDAAKIALLQYAGICYRTGDYEKAVSLYHRAYEEFKAKPRFRGLALNGMAHAHAAKGENEKAVEFYQQLVEDQYPELEDQALFNLGLLYSRTGKPEKSRKAYERLVSEYPDSIFAEPARDRLSG